MIFRPYILPILCVILSFTIGTLTSADGFYKWVDARGHIQYGDKPPENVRLENFEMPALTVIEDYASQWQASDENLTKPVKQQFNQHNSIKQRSIVYEKFAFIAPKINQVIHDKDGDMSAMLSIRPPLKAGHSIVFKLDNKKSVTSKSRIANFTRLNLGYHNLSAEIRDSQGRLVQTSEIVKFRIIRFRSAQLKKK